MNTAARPISECMAATSSGILVISTRAATIRADRPADHQRRDSTQPEHQIRAERGRLFHDQRNGGEHRDGHADHAEHVAADRVVGCDSPFSAWMKQTLATR